MKLTMNLDTVAHSDDLIIQTNAWLAKQVRAGHRNVFLPAGGTPQPLYAQWRRERPAMLAQLNFVQIDEVVTGAQTGLFEKFFRSELPEYQKQFRWVKDCPKPATIAILGFGTNGHIAFHEPELPSSFTFGCVKLSTETVKKLALEESTWGLSFGIGQFLLCEALLLIVSGPDKHEAFQKFLIDDPMVPASFLRKHPNLKILVDAPSIAPNI